jgi:hypothetical protein
MRNLTQKFSMKPPSKTALANRLLGAAAPYSGVTVPVRTPNAPSFFRTNDVVHSSPTVQTPYVLGDNDGFAGFGRLALGSFGAVDPALGLVTGVSFRFDIDKKDFVTGRPIHQEGIRKLGLSWTPVTPNFVQNVDKKLSELRASGPEGETLADTLVGEGAKYAQKVGNVGEGVEFEALFLGARGEVDLFGKVIRKDVEENRLNAMKELKGWMANVLAAPIPASTVTYQPPTGGTPGYRPDSFGPTGGGRQNASGAGAGAGAGAMQKAPGPDFVMYGAIAAAGVVGLLVLRKVMKK